MPGVKIGEGEPQGDNGQARGAHHEFSVSQSHDIATKQGVRITTSAPNTGARQLALDRVFVCIVNDAQDPRHFQKVAVAGSGKDTRSKLHHWV